ncbi:helix-turn-helix domain-containing protein [Microbispora sp. ZYX-F-249]|uniref:Helix-turn-helix domain-containing protein n=1 Tax=Microbispora maris TaxID=3144104 RepID=A0ABV0B0L2_9ACTN
MQCSRPSGGHRVIPAPSGIGTRQEFAEQLTLTRERAGLTVRDVANLVNVPFSTVGGYFSGRHLPPVKPRNLLQDILRACGITDPVQVEEWFQALSRVRRAPGKRPAHAPVPYRGLSSFQIEDAEWFFGRERLTRVVLERVADRRLLVLVGPSGSGKSSVLRAGVIPALKSGALPGADAWKVALFTPGERPLDRLEESAGADLLVVDQFEEVFTAGADETEREKFLDALAVRPAVLCLRADFYSHALRYRSLIPALQNQQIVVGPMTERELRSAIEGPARKACLDLQEGLVELILRDVAPTDRGTGAAHDAGSLPLFSHALLSMWEHSSRNQLTIADYRETGGIRGAVARTAESVYRGLTDPQRRLARQVLLRLVHVAEDTGDTRRRVDLDELYPLNGDVHEVLDSFIAHRLVTTETDQVEIAHEALLVAWPRLREWIDGDRDGLRTHRLLTAAAEVWRESGRDPNALYRGNRLGIAAEWAAEPSHADGLNHLEREFLDASVRHDLAEARLARRRTRRLQQMIAALVVLVLVASLATVHALRQGNIAAEQRDVAISRQLAVTAQKLRRSDLALAAQLSLVAYRTAHTAEARASVLESSPLPGVTRMISSGTVLQAVAVRGNVLATSGADRKIRLWNLAAAGGPAPAGGPLTGHADTVFSLALRPTGDVLASGSGDRTVRLWKIGPQGSAAALSAPLTATGTVYSVAFSPDGRVLAAGASDGSVRFWDVTNPGRPVALGEPVAAAAGAVQSVAFSPDGKVLAAGSADRTVRLWSVADPGHVVPIAPPMRGAGKTVYSVAFSPDGRTLAAASGDTTVRLWDLTRPRRPVLRGSPLKGPASWVNSVAFSPDGQRLAAASSDGNLWMWDLDSGRASLPLPHPGPVTGVVFAGADAVTSAGDGAARRWRLPEPRLTGAQAPVFSVAFGAGNHVLAAVSSDDTARLWNVRDFRRPVPLGQVITHAGGSSPASGAAALTPDARTLAVGTVDGAVQLWDVTSPDRPRPYPLRLTGPGRNIESIAFSPDGRTLAVGGDDSKLWLWNLGDAGHPSLLGTPISDFRNYVYSPVFSPDGRILAAGSADGTARMWDVTDPRRPVPLGSPLTGHGGYVFMVAFSPDGHVLATAGSDDLVRLWDIRDPRRPALIGRPLTGARDYVYSLAFNHNGEILTATDGNGEALTWNVSDPRRPVLLAALAASDQAVFADAYDTGTDVLVTSGADHVVRVWDTDVERVAADVCAITGTAITATEWRQYVPDKAYDPPCAHRT